MSRSLESQLRQIADEAFAQTTPVDVDRRPVAVRPPVESPENKEHVMLKPVSESSQSPRRTRLLAIAASVVVVIVGIVAIALLRDDSDQPAVDPSVPPTSIEEITTTTVESVDTAALAAVGEQLIAAFDSGDTDAVEDLVSDDAEPIAMLGVTTKTGLIDLFGYFDAADLGFEVLECVGSEPNQVSCTLTQSSGFATAARVGPRVATLLLGVDDGQIVALRYGRPESHGPAYQQFRMFVRDDDPEAVEKMWWSDSADNPWPLLTDESFELFDRYVQEFTDAQG